MQESVSLPAVIQVGLNGESAIEQSVGGLPPMCIEPVAIRADAAGFEMVATSSGRYGSETNLIDEVISIRLTKTLKVTSIDPLASGLGHRLLDVKAMESTRHGFVVALRADGDTRFIGSTSKAAITPSRRSNLTNLAQHDRLVVSGLHDAWLTEITPGQFHLEVAQD